MSNTLKFGSNADTSRRPTSPHTLSVRTIWSNQTPRRKSAPTNPVPKSSPRSYSLSRRQRPPPVRSPLTSASTEWTPPRTPLPATPPTPSPGRPPLLSPWPGYRKNPLQHLSPPSKTPRCTRYPTAYTDERTSLSRHLAAASSRRTRAPAKRGKARRPRSRRIYRATRCWSFSTICSAKAQRWSSPTI